MKRITSAQVIQAVSTYYGLSVDALKGPSRKQSIVRPRMMAYYLCRELTELSLNRIGQIFGGRDHSTVLHGARMFPEFAKRDPQLATDENLIRIYLVHGPANDNEAPLSDDLRRAEEMARKEFQRKEAEQQQRIRQINAQIKRYFDSKEAEREQKRVASLNDMDAISYRVAQYAKRPLAERMAD